MIKNARHSNLLVHGTLLTTLLFTAGANGASPAGVKLDGSIGGAAQVLPGPTYNITQSLGKVAGSNLFYSFQYFNIATGETALFTTTSAGIDNVISRVTGGYTSTIDGTIRLTAASGTPNFFLINPNGVTFTANAVVDVPAAFYVTTANYLKFPDGNFYADPGKMSTLSASAPEAFGFLGTTRAPVNVLGANLSAGLNGAGTFQIAAGDVTIDGQGGQTNNGTLEPLGIANTTGDIRVTAVGGASGEVPLSGPFAATDGTVTIRNGGALITQGSGASQGGNIDVNTGSLLIDGLGLPFVGNFYAGITTSTDVLGLGLDAAGSVTINVANDATIVDGGTIGSQSFGAGRSGNVSLVAKSLSVDGENSPNYTGLFTYLGSSGSAGTIAVQVAGNVSVVNGGNIGCNTSASGNCGSVSLNANSLSLVNGGNIACETAASGNCGSVSLNANSLAIDAEATAVSAASTGIYDQAAPGSSGSAGDVVMNVKGATSIVNGGEINTNTLGAGNAGPVTLNSGSLTINGGPGLYVSGIFAGNEPLSPTVGMGANININVSGAISILNDGVIFSGTYGSANAGNISLTGASLTLAASVPANYNLAYNYLSVPDTEISTNTHASGNAGNIYLNVGSLTITGGDPNYFVGVTSADANPIFGIYGSPAGAGASGSIIAKVNGPVTLQDGGQITTGTYGSGSAGSVGLTAKSLTIGGGSNASGIFSQASVGSSGQTGQITIDTGSLAVSSNGFIDISNAATVTNSNLVIPTQIKIDARDIHLDGGDITAESTGNVTASEININYSGGLRMDSGTIATSAVDGNGGAISISGQGPIWLNRSNITTSVLGSSGNGGNISVSVPIIVMNTAAIQANTAAIHASGGSVDIDAATILPSFQSMLLGGTLENFDPNLPGSNFIQAAAPDGIGGVLNVAIPTLDIGSSLLALTQRPAAPAALGRSLCDFSKGSSLSVTGRGGSPSSASEPIWFDWEDDSEAAAGKPNQPPSAVSFLAGLSACRR